MAEQKLPLDNGETVIVDQGRSKSTLFNITDLYKYRMVDDGPDIVSAGGVYVAEEDDLVIDYDQGLYRVSRTDYTTYVNDLVRWETPKTASEVGVEDVLLGSGPGYPSQSWRCLIDTRVTPHRLQLDRLLHFYGSGGKEVRVFKGTNISESGTIISAYYNESGSYVGDALPLEVVSTESGNNVAQKAPVTGYTTYQLDDGEVVTAVCYDYDGSPTSIAKLLVHNNNIVRRPDQGMKKVSSIELISPYISASESNVLEVPINLNVSSLTMRGKVNYTDGSSAIIDLSDETTGGKFVLLGLKYWSPAIAGPMTELTLMYELNANEEYSHLQGLTYSGTITRPYFIRPMPINNAYSLKLYAFPVWVDDVTGYRLNYWLYDLDRAVSHRVPANAIELSETSASFNGLDFVSTQILNVGVNLKLIDPVYGEHRHVQIIQIALLREGSVRASNWKVKFSSNQVDWFGNGLEAVIKYSGSGVSDLDIDNNEVNYDTWLEKHYYKAEPLYDAQTELRAPLPTHFVLVTKTRQYECPINNWQTTIKIINDLNEGEALFIKWIKRTVNTDLQLAVTALPVHLI